MDNLPPNFSPSLVEEVEVLICDNSECAATETIHFAAVGDLCYDCMLGHMRPATELEQAEIRAWHADCPND